MCAGVMLEVSSLGVMTDLSALFAAMTRVRAVGSDASKVSALEFGQALVTGAGIAGQKVGVPTTRQTADSVLVVPCQARINLALHDALALTGFSVALVGGVLSHA
jgi:hypothetical protein